MASDSASPWQCQVCGHTGHTYQHHLGEEEVPEFVHASVVRLRALEQAGSEIHPLVTEVSHLAENEEGARKAWAMWLQVLFEELEDAADAPDVAAEIENFLIGGF